MKKTASALAVALFAAGCNTTVDPKPAAPKPADAKPPATVPEEKAPMKPAAQVEPPAPQTPAPAPVAMADVPPTPAASAPPPPATAAAPSAYFEVSDGDKVYVFGSDQAMAQFYQTHKAGETVPKAYRGKTVLFDAAGGGADALMKKYESLHK